VVPVVSHLAKHIFDVVIEKNLAVVPFAKVA
jgi:hypothetical protein